MSNYIIPDSTILRPIKLGVATVETIEAVMADRPCAILSVASDCLEDVDVVDGGWVAVDFTRRPASPRYRSKDGDGDSDLYLCYTAFSRAPGPAVVYKEYQGVWGSWQMVGTRYKSMWEGDKLRLNYDMVVKRIFGMIVASYGQDGRLLWQRNPEEFPKRLGITPIIHGDVTPYQGVRA